MWPKFTLFLCILFSPVSYSKSDVFPEGMYLYQQMLGSVTSISSSNGKTRVVIMENDMVITITREIPEHSIKQFLGGQASLLIVRDENGHGNNEGGRQKIYLCFGRSTDCGKVLDISERGYKEEIPQ